MSVTYKGFTLIEMMIVVAIIGILAAIAYPSYERFIIKSNRADMMGELHNIGSSLQSQKLAQGSYTKVTTTDLTGVYPRQGKALYDVTIAPSTLNDKWTFTATPKTTMRMKSDGTLTLDYQGIKCRNVGTTKTCGANDEWNK